MDATFSWDQLFTSNWEFLGFATGILSVLLLLPTHWVRVQWLAWPFGVVTSAIYLFLFYDWTLYGNAILQVPFVLISAHGAWLWRGQLRGIVEGVKELPTTYASRSLFALCCTLSLVAMVGVYPLLSHYNDASPLWDGLILTISLSAIFLQLRKHVQCWYLWIIVDIIAIPFHFDQGRGATAILYLAYMLMCFVGLRTWRSVSYVNAPYAVNAPFGTTFLWDQTWNGDEPIEYKLVKRTEWEEAKKKVKEDQHRFYDEYYCQLPPS